MARKKKEMTPAQKAAARKNPDAPKKDKEQKKPVNALNDANPFGGIGVTFLLLFVILGCVFAFLYLNDFFGMSA